MLRAAADPVGPHTDRLLEHVLDQAGGDVVVAWVCTASYTTAAAMSPASCMRAAHGCGAWARPAPATPRHPLYVRADTALQPYQPLS